MKDLISYDELHRILDYDRESGIFIWKISHANIKIGSEAGVIDSHGYRVIRINGKLYKAHRLAWLYIYGYFPENDIDHRDRTKSHNWIDNLREVSRGCNTRNSGNRKDNTSGIKGVCYVKNNNNWLVRITINQKTRSIGCYEDFNDAVCARLAAEQCLNWSGCDVTSSAYLYVKNNIQMR